MPTNYDRWDPSVLLKNRDMQVADSLRVVVDAMRLQSGKKDEKPEKARKTCALEYPMLKKVG